MIPRRWRIKNERKYVNLSQGLEVLLPEVDKAIPFPCNEWDFLKDKIHQLSKELGFFQSAGSMFICAELAKALSLYTCAVSAASARNDVFIAIC